jgi:hypothetical protein
MLDFVQSYEVGLGTTRDSHPGVMLILSEAKIVSIKVLNERK